MTPLDSITHFDLAMRRLQQHFVAMGCLGISGLLALVYALYCHAHQASWTVDEGSRQLLSLVSGAYCLATMGFFLTTMWLYDRCRNAVQLVHVQLALLLRLEGERHDPPTRLTNTQEST